MAPWEENEIIWFSEMWDIEKGYRATKSDEENNLSEDLGTYSY